MWTGCKLQTRYNMKTRLDISGSTCDTTLKHYQNCVNEEKKFIDDVIMTVTWLMCILQTDTK